MKAGTTTTWNVEDLSSDLNSGSFEYETIRIRSSFSNDGSGKQESPSSNGTKGNNNGGLSPTRRPSRQRSKSGGSTSIPLKSNLALNINEESSIMRGASNLYIEAANSASSQMELRMNELQNSLFQLIKIHERVHEEVVLAKNTTNSSQKNNLEQTDHLISSFAELQCQTEKMQASLTDLFKHAETVSVELQKVIGLEMYKKHQSRRLGLDCLLLPSTAMKQDPNAATSKKSKYLYSRRKSPFSPHYRPTLCTSLTTMQIQSETLDYVVFSSFVLQKYKFSRKKVSELMGYDNIHSNNHSKTLNGESPNTSIWNLVMNSSRPTAQSGKSGCGVIVINSNRPSIQISNQ